MISPKYPIYIPTRGRLKTAHTARCLRADGIPFYMVVEESERVECGRLFGTECVLTLPQRDRGLIYARNWIKEHATMAGAARHWQLDDNIAMFMRLYEGRRIACDPGIALRVCEDFTDRYTNVAISGLNYATFLRQKDEPPFYRNCRVYSCSLINNAIPHRWRSALNDDTDICLQVLADGWCTVLLNAFLCHKLATMTVKGGNTSIYTSNDGRLKMARSLERLWPGVVTTDRRFKRPQHVVAHAWRHFDTPLRRNPDVRISAGANEYGMNLTVKDRKAHRAVKRLAQEYRRG